MTWIPPRPDVPVTQRSAGPVLLRFEDIAQDGRVGLESLTLGLGETGWKSLMSDPARAAGFTDAGVLPILVRMVVEGGGGPVSVNARLRAEGAWQFAHSVGADGAIDRIVLAMWSTLRGRVGRTYGPPPEDAGAEVEAGSVWAEHVCTRPFAAPEDRRVTRLAIPGVPVDPSGVPPARTQRRDPASAGIVPEGHTALGDLAPDAAPVVFGLTHTDSNRHVNSLAYPRLFEDAALRRLAALGQPVAALRSRRVEVAWRKPCFAGDRMRVVLQPYALDGGLGAAGAFVPEGDAAARPHCWIRMEFDRSE